jgi:hypothetical protein
MILRHGLSKYDGLEARKTSKLQNRRPLFDVELLPHRAIIRKVRIDRDATT